MSPRRTFAALAAFAAFAALLLAPAAALAQASPSPFTSGTRYDLAGRLTGTISADPDGVGVGNPFLAVRNSYDQVGRLTRVESGTLLAWQAETVAPADWESHTTFTVQHTLETQYDALSRKTREILHEGGVTGTIRGVTQYSYDNVGRLECTAVRMNAALYASLPSSACTQATPAGSDGADRISRTVYDAASQRVQARSGVGTADEAADATFDYDADGQITTMIDANGNRAAYHYDGFERQVSWLFPSTTAPTAYDFSTQAAALASSGSANSADHEDYGYDANGNRTSLTKRDGSILSYQYDALNRVTLKTVPERLTGAQALTTAQTRDVYYGYDNRNLQLSVRFDSLTGEGVTNAYDGLGHLISTSTNMGGTTRTLTYQYDADGNRTRITHADGSANNYFLYTYDGLDRLTLIRENGTDWLSGYSFSSFGPIAEQGHDSAAGMTSRIYDGVGREYGLFQTIWSASTYSVGAVVSFNPASQVATASRNNDLYAWNPPAAGSRAYTTNGLNQYSDVAGTAILYDANGNLTSSTPPSPLVADHFVYDIENRLVSVSGAHAATLAYDPLGRLWQLTNGTSGAVTQFVYDGDALVAEYNGAGAMTARYVHGVDAGDDPLVAYDGASVGAAHRTYLYGDRQGSIILTTDSAGGTDQVNAYDEYGYPNTTNHGRFQYTGQAWLAELGLYYYKARIYSPTLGRFLQVDPVGYAGGDNLYEYVGDDPVDGVDPSGDVAIAIPIAGAAWEAIATAIGEVVAFVGYQGEAAWQSRDQGSQTLAGPATPEMIAHRDELAAARNSSRNPPVPGTGRGASRPQYGAVRPGQPGPPRVVRPTHGPKKSDAPQEAGRQGRYGGVIGSRGDRGRMGGRQDDEGHQGGPPHGHPPEGQGEGHLWERPRPQ